MSQVAGWITHRYAKYVVIGFWLVVTVLLGPLAGKLTGAQENDAESWLPAGAESTEVIAAAQAFVPDSVVPAVVVYERDGGLTAADAETITADVAAFGDLDALGGDVVGPFPSQDGEAVQVVVPVDAGEEGWDGIAPAVEALRATAEEGAGGLATYVTGPAGQAADSSAAFEGIDGTLLYAAGGVVIVMLLLTYRSPVLWLLPVVSAVVALTVSQAVVYLMADRLDLTVNAQSAGILTVLVFGAGTDYALLLVARYREELRKNGDRHAAMAVALHRAGPAIIASAATVAAGMLCLLLATMNSTAGLGPVAAVGIGVALVVMLTLLPALLVTCGRWVFWPRVPHVGDAEPTERGFWSRVGAQVARHPRRTWVATASVLAVASLGWMQLDPTGLTNEESFRTTQPSIEGEKVLAAHFDGGAGAPVVVVADADAAADVRAAFADVEGIDPATVTEPVVQGGLAYLEGTLESAPDSAAADATVDRVRDAVHAVPGADAIVGGTTATDLDVQRASAADNRLIIPVILLVVFLILVLLLRAVVAPLVLMGTVILSFGAAIGISALVFRYAFGFGGTDSSFPLYTFVFLVALGIDYNIFLMTRVREEALRVGHRRGTLVGLSATGGVITSAGLVLAGTFAALGTMPVVSFAEIGFAVALGVLLDTLVVRSILVTALNLDVGPRMWWPSALSRRPDPSAPTRPAHPSHRADAQPVPDTSEHAPVG
ncbi:MMPL family transporter [Cellulomonas biazotea]|uniref:Putative membrane protein ActII-3 n=1 Tax=Cellulomonas biazotea TaxID=1709 RepID=A0A402DVV6_9CELL|nr:MMPL family transporter [Cellulomonas biazotea]GCE78279.1 putative membrane protein ActII-3 [Cellulomonas biazotea]